MTTLLATRPLARATLATETEHTLTLPDGATLSFRAWLPDTPTDKALILFHRGHEHSARWRATVEALALDNVAVFAWDQRGHGHSSGERGSAPGFPTVVNDADVWVRHLVAEFGVDLSQTIVLGHSLGALVAAAWTHDYAPPIRGLVLATPAFQIKLYVPCARQALAAKEQLLGKLLGPGYVKSFIQPWMLTHDPAQAEAYAADPLIFPQIAVNMLLDVHHAAKRLLDDAGAFHVPLLVLAAGSDWVVQEKPQRQFVERASSAVKKFEVLPGFSHAVFHERNVELVVGKVRDFVHEHLASPEQPASPTPRQSLIHADREGYTHAEYQRLQQPSSLQFRLTRWLLEGPGRLSQGIRIGCEHGFDSGVMLDYVYQNRPRGFTPLGWLIDKCFLDAIGWRGIRVRRTLLDKALSAAIETRHAAGRPARILDIASGPGRYVLETIHRLRDAGRCSAVLRDYKAENLAAAQRLCDELHLPDITIEHGDAFDRASLGAISPRPSTAIASGIYELIPDNTRVLASLRGIADALESGGSLIYTAQIWHPQLEFIARTLTNREGQPWVMRRRTQAEIDELVAAAGFEKVSQEMDPWGMFTVSTARKIGR